MHVCRELTSDQPDGLPLVEMELIRFDLTDDHNSLGRSPGRYYALVMPVYATTLAKLVHAPPRVVLAQGRRMVQALDHIHKRGYVHMDVKVRKFIVDHGGIT